MALGTCHSPGSGLCPGDRHQAVLSWGPLAGWGGSGGSGGEEMSSPAASAPAPFRSVCSVCAYDASSVRFSLGCAILFAAFVNGVAS